MKGYTIFKRIMDIVVALLMLLVTSPVMLVVALAVKLGSKGPVFFTQERVGKDRVLFDLYKFRTMRPDEEAEKSNDFSKDEERVTGIGNILRKTKLDELPQLINVLKGDMSLVGPRPTVKIQVDNYTDYQMQRLKVTPGMTGLVQVSGGKTLPWSERIDYDIYYIEHISFLLDLEILFKTLAVVVFGEERFKKEKFKE